MGGGSVEEFEKLIIEAATLVLERAALAVKNKEKLTEAQKTIVKKSIGELILAKLGKDDDILLELFKRAYESKTTKLPDIKKVTPQTDLKVIPSEPLPMVSVAAGGTRRMRGGFELMTAIAYATMAVMGFTFEMIAQSRQPGQAVRDQIQMSCISMRYSIGNKCPYPLIIKGEGKPTWDDDYEWDWVCKKEGAEGRCNVLKEKFAKWDNIVSTCQDYRNDEIGRLSRWKNKVVEKAPHLAVILDTEFETCLPTLRSAYGDAPPGWTYEAEPEGFDQDQEEEAYAKANKVSPTRKKQQQASMSPRAVSPIDFTRTERRNSVGTTKLELGGGRRMQSRKTRHRRLRKAMRTRRNKRSMRK